MRHRVDKLVAKQAYEAVHEVLQHYQSWSMDLEQNGGDRPEHLIHEYGNARRLRDYLRNVLRAQAQPELDLGDEDRDLLVSCCLFAVQSLSDPRQTGSSARTRRSGRRRSCATSALWRSRSRRGHLR